MAFNNRVAQSMPGFGSPSYNGSIQGVAATALGENITIGSTSALSSSTGGGTILPFNTSGGPPPTRGKARIKTTGMTGTFILTSIIVYDSGGVSAQVAGPLAADSSASNVDYTHEFNTDINIVQVEFNFTISTAVGTIDAEVALV
jgi:hypothetical protein